MALNTRMSSMCIESILKADISVELIYQADIGVWEPMASVIIVPLNVDTNISNFHP